MTNHITQTFQNLSFLDAANATSFPGTAKRGAAITQKLQSYTAYGIQNVAVHSDNSSNWIDTGDGYPPTVLVVDLDTTVDPSQAILLRNLIALTVHLYYDFEDAGVTFNFVPLAVQQQLNATANAGQAQVKQILANTSPWEYLLNTGNPIGAVEMGVKAIASGGVLPEDYQPEVDNSWSGYLPWLIGAGVIIFVAKKVL
jgi:hypothetical protein